MNVEQRSEAPLMRETIYLALFCLFMTGVSLAALIWAVGDAVVDRLPSEILNMDGLLLIAICLLLATIFAFCFAWFARDAGLWEMVKSRRQAGTEPEQAPSQPASTASNDR